MELPAGNYINSDRGLVMNQGSLLAPRKHQVKHMKISMVAVANDPSEQMFRKMMNKIQLVDKEIKVLNSQNLKQTTFIDPNALKRKVNAEYPSKKPKIK